MKKSVFLGLSLALAAAAAFAAMGDLVGSFPNVGTWWHRGLAVDASYLYSYCETGFYIDVINKGTGARVASYPCPLGSQVYGLDYDGGNYIYAVDLDPYVVGKLRPSDGSLVSSFPYTPVLFRPICVEYDKPASPPTGVYTCQSRVYRYFTTSGSFISSFSAPVAGTNVVDLAWDYGNKYIWASDYGTNYIYGLATTGSIITSWRAPGSVENVYGIAYFAEYLYVSNEMGNAPQRYIWKYHCPNRFNAVNPASLGRVKALFN